VPPRKRRVRRKSNRRRVPERSWYSLSLLALLALVVVTVQVCTRSQKQKYPVTASHPQAGRGGSAAFPPRIDRNQIASRYNALLIQAGGARAWLKHAAKSADRDQAHDVAGGANGEVLVLAPASALVVAALEREAAGDGLRLDIEPPRDEAAAAVRTVSIWRGQEQLCAWRVREVPRLYRAAIVIDDLGQELKPARELLRVPYALTFSVLPDLPQSWATAAAAHESDREVMLHLPMEPLSAAANPGAGAIRVGMPGNEVDRVIDSDLESVPYVAGVNNHMGSRATSDPALMAEVMKKLAARRLYFIDSRTAGSTVALDAARRAGMPAFYRSVFLDDTESVDYTLGQLRRLRDTVQTQGVALAIGHPHPTTITALESFLPSLERDDIELVPASRLAELSDSARLSPHAAPKSNGDYRR
jgi:polysaccharide deacetylase 2 family uncharacterized protein YibQ